MARMREHLSEKLILLTLLHEGGDDLRVTRLDVALDVHESGLRPADLRACESAGLINPRSKVRFWIDRRYPNGRSAQSWQIGNKNAKHLMIYEKGPESGNFDLDKLRLEMRYKQKHGLNALKSALEHWPLVGFAKSALKAELRPADGALDFFLDAPEVKVNQEVRDRDFDTLWYWCDTTAMSALKRLEALRAGTVAELLRAHGLLPHDCT